MSRPRVLVVDDHPQVCSAIRRVLRRDFDVQVTASAIDAVDLVAAGASFDAMILDVLMPRLDGLDVARRVMTTAPELARRIVFISADGVRAPARLAGDPRPLLLKPFAYADLRTALQTAMGRGRPSKPPEAA